MAWWYDNERGRVGPLDEPALRGLMTTVEISEETLVWRLGQTTWSPVKDIPTLSAHLKPPPLPPRQLKLSETAFCSVMWREDRIDQVMASRVESLAPVPVLADPYQRLLARLIDIQIFA